MFEIEKYHAELRAAELPYSLIIDSGHILPPFFDGNPIITALGVGPLTKEESKILRKLKLCQ